MVLFNDRRRKRPAPANPTAFAPKPGQGPKVIETKEVKPGTITHIAPGAIVAKTAKPGTERSMKQIAAQDAAKPKNPKAQRYIGGHL